ncbi:MAG: helix-turn-helix domain-containing protein [Oscillospiraceae bacterium]|nr:helix-turn-helix domain-containing protein [Oscillospiraceae bacterium]
MLKTQLKLLRQKKGLTKKAVAKAIGITERAYIAYEYGERDVSTETLVKLAKYFGVTTDYLLGIETKPNPLDMLDLSDVEKAILQVYISVNSEKRKSMEDFLVELAAGADIQLLKKKLLEPERENDDKYITYTTTLGAEMDRIEAEQEQKAGELANDRAKKNVV